MDNCVLWKFLFRCGYAGLAISISFLVVSVFHIPNSPGWGLLIIALAFSFILPLPVIKDTEEIAQDRRKKGPLTLEELCHDGRQDDPDFIMKECDTLTDLCTYLQLTKEETNVLFEEYFRPRPHGPFRFSNKTFSHLKNILIAKQFRDKGISSSDKNSSELCLIGSASTVYRQIFEPILGSKDERLRAIGLFGREIIYWLVSNGDVQSVVSRFDLNGDNNTENNYDILKKVSLCDHLLNTCMNAYKIALDDQLDKHSIFAYLAAAAGLAHDLGKHQKFYPMENGKLHYRSCDHPLYSVDAATYFMKRAGIKSSLLSLILDAVSKHHMENTWQRKSTNIPPLAWIVQEADRKTRHEEMFSREIYKNKIKDTQAENSPIYIVIHGGTEAQEKITIENNKRPFNHSKTAPVPPPLRQHEAIKIFLAEYIGPCINRYISNVSNIDLQSTTPTYACFSYGNDLMVRMSLMEKLWEEYANSRGVDLCSQGERYPMQMAIKGLLQYLDQLEPGLVQRPLLPPEFAFLMIEVQQGRDRWTKPANYIPLSLQVFCEITELDAIKLENIKIAEDNNNSGSRDFLSRICGWRRHYS